MCSASDLVGAARLGQLDVGAVGRRRLLLTHLWPITDRTALQAEAAAAYGADVELAEPGRTYEV